jgi:hypothetical protein
MNRLLSFIRYVLRGGNSGHSQDGLFAFQSAAFDKAQMLVRVFYATNLFWAALRLEERARWNSYDAIYPLWPLSWLQTDNVSTIATSVFVFNTVVAALALIYVGSTSARWLAFAGALFAGAFENSFGRICHYGHAWVWVTFFFAFLPSGQPSQFTHSRILRQRFLQVFWSAQFALLFFYSMAGWLKLVSVPVQLMRDEVTAIGPEALARHIANCAMQGGPQPLLASWLVDHIMIGWVLFLGAIYLEAAALLAAFRPAIHRWWGIGLIMLHLGIGLAMEIWFVPPMFLLALLFVYSPFQTEGTTWSQMLCELPGVDLIAWIARRRIAADALALRPRAQSASS